MIQKKIKVTNETGLHCRPGNQFVKLAKNYESEITVKKGDKEFSAKSLLKLMKIGISQGDEIEITCNGSDEQKALDDICNFISNLKE